MSTTTTCDACKAEISAMEQRTRIRVERRYTIPDKILDLCSQCGRGVEDRIRERPQLPAALVPCGGQHPRREQRIHCELEQGHEGFHQALSETHHVWSEGRGLSQPLAEAVAHG